MLPTGLFHFRDVGMTNPVPLHGYQSYLQDISSPSPSTQYASLVYLLPKDFPNIFPLIWHFSIIQNLMGLLFYRQPLFSILLEDLRSIDEIVSRNYQIF